MVQPMTILKAYTDHSEELSPNEQLLFWRLYLTNNKAGWADAFGATNLRLLMECGFSEPTLLRCRNTLKEKGYIDFKPGKKRMPTTYRITIHLKKHLNNLSENVSKSVSENVRHKRQETSNKLQERKKGTTYPKKSALTVPFDEIVDLFHSLCPSLPNIRGMTEQRKRVVGKRYAEDFKRDMEEVRSFFSRVERSDFLTGRSGKDFQASFDWIFAPRNFIKIIEGNYDNRYTRKSDTDRMDEIRRQAMEVLGLERQESTDTGDVDAVSFSFSDE